MERSRSLRVGVIVRRSPGVTRWVADAFRVAAIVPGDSRPATWAELRRDGEIVDYYAGSAPLTLWRTDTEAYLVALNADPASVWVVLRKEGDGPGGLTLQAVTASAYEAQDYMDNGEDLVERVPMPEGVQAWIAEFCAAHPVTDAFVKRKRSAKHETGTADGIGDARVRQVADVYRAPGGKRGP